MNIKHLFAAAAAAGLLSFGAAAQADTFTASNGTLSASADITFAGGILTVDITNTQDVLLASNGAISGILLGFSTDPTGVGAFTQDGNLYNLNGTTNTATPIAGDPDHWGAFFLLGDVRLTTLTGGQPRDLIGPSSATGDFSGLNNGILNFNPYIDGTGHFTVALTGLESAHITSVIFQYGTNVESIIGGDCDRTGDCGGGGGEGGGVPEPAIWSMMIMGFGGVGAMMRRRRSLLA